jgi:hypothetical protein
MVSWTTPQQVSSYRWRQANACCNHNYLVGKGSREPNRGTLDVAQLMEGIKGSAAHVHAELIHIQPGLSFQTCSKHIACACVSVRVCVCACVCVCLFVYGEPVGLFQKRH